MNKIDQRNFLYDVKREANGPIVRISVSNLISDMDSRVIGILNKKSVLKKKRNIGAIGGAALLFGQNEMKKIGGYDFEGYDARFKMPVKNMVDLMLILRSDHGNVFENNPDREIIEELTEEVIPGVMDGPILSDQDSFFLTSKYRETVFEKGFGVNEQRDILTVYIWRYFKLLCPDSVEKDILSSNVIYSLSADDIAAGVTRDGLEIGPNLKEAGKIVYKV